jgi:acyl carrier protein
MTLKKDEALRVIAAALEGLDGAPASKTTATVGPATLLIGPDGCLDSIGLVTLIVAVEERLADEFGLSVTLASEKAVAAKTSPFRSIEKFADYVVEVTRGG